MSHWIALLSGWLIMLGGAASCAWGLLGDRSRGRLRCPKCWYDMSHSPGRTCSECGRTAKKGKHLRQTRRHWRYVALGAFVVAAGWVVCRGPKIAAVGWAGAAPSTLMVLCLPEVNDEPSSLWRWADAELTRRLRADELWHWQLRMLVWRCVDDDDLPWTCFVTTRPVWLNGVPVRCRVTYRKHRTGWNWFDGIRARISMSEQSGAGATTFWWGAAHDEIWVLGHRPPGTEKLEIDVLCEAMDIGRDVRLWGEEIALPVSIREDWSEVLRPVDSQEVGEALRETLRFWISAYNLRIDSPTGRCTTLEGVSPGARFELWRDDVCVATTDGWWMRDGSGAQRTFRWRWMDPQAIHAPANVQLPWKWLDKEAAPRVSTRVGNWSLRLIGDPAVVLANHEEWPAVPVDQPVSYWAGDMKIELVCDWYNGPLRPKTAPRLPGPLGIGRTGPPVAGFSTPELAGD